jgi:DnaK suppressor protein
MMTMPIKPQQKPSSTRGARKGGPGPGGTAASAAAEVKQMREDLDIEYFRNLLLQEMSRLEEEREFLRKSSSDMDGNLPEDAEGEEDTADLASSLMDKEMDMSVEEEIEETLLSIEHALQKMEDGTYGICDVSGKPIPRGRLELIPWASLTVECQALAEGE